MFLARENGCIKFYADTYSLEFVMDRPYVFLANEKGARIADLFFPSSIHPMHGRDDTTRIGSWRVDEGLDEVLFRVEVTSSVWDKKIYRFRCQPRRFRYEIEVTGQGDIAEARYFGGHYSGQVRWGSGFFWSGQRFAQGFNPEPTSDEIYTFPPEINSSINLTGVPLPGKADWFFTPPPFCFAFETQTRWIGLGIEARPGQNLFSDYQYHGNRSAFHLSLAFDGSLHVDGSCLLPAVSFDFGPDPYTLLATHVQHLRSAGLVPTPVVHSRPDWWVEPIFCGWGAQCHLAKTSGGRGPDYATQASYEAFLHTLHDQGIQPGTIVLDDKWQLTYGENEADPAKWPDLPGFIRARHEEGQHILLWLKAWDPEGIPVEECITNAAGLPLAFDPTNPSFERRIRQSVRRMLSPDAYNADGFKIDFSARIPCGPGLRSYGDLWGLELMRRYLSILNDEARRVKPDAFIITHTPHPYLADLLDAIRLNDINTPHDVYQQMSHRARVAAIACPEALIDMDNWPMCDKATWREYLSHRPMLGIPALYFASHIDSTDEPLTREDYALIRVAWAEYRASLSARQRQTPVDKVSKLGRDLVSAGSPAVKKLGQAARLSAIGKPLKGWDHEAISGLL